MSNKHSVTRRPRVALYARVSTSDQNTALQVDELRQVAGQRDWQIIGEFVDVGVSGSKDRRPELDKLMRLAHAGKLDVVAVWKFDRFARSTRHLVTALEEFRAKGIDFVSVRDCIDTSTATGRFTFSIIAGMAELERELIRERTVAGLQAARRRGARLGRPRVGLNTGRVRELRAEGQSVRAIGRQLGVAAATIQRVLQAAQKSPLESVQG